MAAVDYYAWFLYDARPYGTPEFQGHKQTNIPRSTKVSVCEEYFRDGVKWLRIVAPAGFPADPAYPEWWIPAATVSSKVTDLGKPKPGSVDLKSVPEEVISAIVTILAWLKS